MPTATANHQLTRDEQIRIINNQTRQWQQARYSHEIDYRVNERIEAPPHVLDAIKISLRQAEKALDVLSGLLEELNGTEG